MGASAPTRFDCRKGDLTSVVSVISPGVAVVVPLSVATTDAMADELAIAATMQAVSMYVSIEARVQRILPPNPLVSRCYGVHGPFGA